MTAAIMRMAIDVPKSGSGRINATRPSTTIAIGSTEYVTSSIRCIRRSSSAAMKKMATSFASSDGCTPMPPTPNQRRAPFTARAKIHAHEREGDKRQAWSR